MVCTGKPLRAVAAMALLGLAAILSQGDLAHAQEVVYVDDPLTSSPSGNQPGVTAGSRGGSFGADGWTVTGDENTVYYVIPAALPRGRVEVTVTGLSTETNLTGALHDLLVIYGTTDQAEPVSYAPYFRSDDFKVQVRVIGTAETSRGPGASKLELRRCPMGHPGYHEECDPSCQETVASAYLNGAPMAPLPWNPSRDYRLRVTWESGQMSYDRGDSPVYIDYPGTFAPEELVVRLGSPRHRDGTDNRLPNGMTYSDVLVVGEPGAPTASCLDDPGPDGPCLSAVSLEPADGSGQSATLRATYEHCEGASTFRIVQIWVGDEVAPGVPHLGGGFENGWFGSEAGSCQPGDDARLTTEWGYLDCTTSDVTFSGDLAVADWTLGFNPATFAGTHGVFFDAKGGDGDPEPRLGWTHMGQFTVVADPRPEPSDGPAEPAPDAGQPDSSTTDAEADQSPVDSGAPDAPSESDAVAQDTATGPPSGLDVDDDMPRHQGASDTPAETPVEAPASADQSLEGGCGCALARAAPGRGIRSGWLIWLGLSGLACALKLRAER